MSTLERSHPPLNFLGPDYLDAAFNAEGYASGLPQVFHKANEPWRFAVNAHGASVRHGAEAAAFCAGFPFLWCTRRHGFVRALGLGSVATRPGCEGKGLASRALLRALGAAAERSFDGVFLFAEGAKARLYEKTGFLAACQDAFVFLHPQAAGDGAGENAIRIAKAHADLVKKGFGKSRRFLEASAQEVAESPLRVARLWQALSQLSCPRVSMLGWWEFQQLLSIPSLRLRWVEREGGIEALCFLGKGADFQNVLHGLVARSEREALFLLGESAARFPESTVTLLVDGDPALVSSLVVSSSDAVQLMTKALPAGGRTDAAFQALFHSGVLRVRGLQSC